MPVHSILPSTCLSISLLSFAAAGASCTTPAKNFCADDSQCAETGAPFCDVSGEFSDEPNSCIPYPFDATPTTVVVAIEVDGSGAGQVDSSDANISCASGVCTAEVMPGTNFEFSATPSAGSSFVAWGDDPRRFDLRRLPSSPKLRRQP